MEIKKVWIEDGCTACGLCESICPEVFTVNDEATVNQGVNFAEFSHQIKDAADSCPIEVIIYEEKKKVDDSQ
jgi:ferredoxin